MSLKKLLVVLKGSSRSGNYGHAGRPGKRGGSAPKTGWGAAMSIRTGKLSVERNSPKTTKIPLKNRVPVEKNVGYAMGTHHTPSEEAKKAWDELVSNEENSKQYDEILKLDKEIDSKQKLFRKYISSDKDEDIDSLSKEIRELKAKRNNLDEDLAERNRTVVQGPKDFTLNNVTVEKGVDTKGLEDFTRLCANDKISDVKMNLRTTKELASNAHGTSVYMSEYLKSDVRAITVHEIGHWYELNLPGVKEKAINYWKSRTGNLGKDKVSEMNTYGYNGMRASKGKFKQEYNGKIYPNGVGEIGATEIVSLGVEQMFRNPVAFAKSDPDYFAFVYDIMRG